MKDILTESTKVAAYLLWENTKQNMPLDLWYCVENIAFYFEKNDIITMVALEEILRKPKSDTEYLRLLKNVSYRIFLSTKNRDHLLNWFVSENLLNNYEWCRAIVNMASVFRAMREGKVELGIRTDWIKRELENKN